VIKIDKNKKGVAMFDRAQWFLASMSIALSVQLNQPVAAAVPLGKVVQTAQTNSSDAAETALKEGVQLYQQGMAQAQRSAILKFEQALKLYREAGDRRGEATTLTWIGLVYAELGKNQKALEYYNQTLPLWRALGITTGKLPPFTPQLISTATKTILPKPSMTLSPLSKSSKTSAPQHPVQKSAAHTLPQCRKTTKSTLTC
jgi:tetratricopeptide (TPR) repeat protein